MTFKEELRKLNETLDALQQRADKFIEEELEDCDCACCMDQCTECDDLLMWDEDDEDG